MDIFFKLIFLYTNFLLNTPLNDGKNVTLFAGEVTSTDSTLQKESVSISTIHASKGLEWVCVFVPAVEVNIFPHVRSTSVVQVS
jgi:superfamily I DNA/RNA helicase